MSDEERNLETARLLVARWNAGDVEGVLDLLSEDVVSETHPDWPESGPWEGRQGLRAQMVGWREAWDRIEFTFQELRAYGDKIISRGSWASRGKASGVDATLEFSLIWTLRDGRISRLQWFFDHDEAIRAAG